jgi:hypothetical protein
MKSYFGVEKNDNEVLLFNIENMPGLNTGDIFFKRTDEEILILQEYEFLDKEYINKIVDDLSEDEHYDYQLLLDKSIPNVENYWLKKLKDDLLQNRYNLKQVGLYNNLIKDGIENLLEFLKNYE